MSETSPNIKPLVTVVVPVFNKASTLIRTLSSVAAQSLSNLEVFVVNDGSTDHSEDLIQGFIKDDPRFHYIYQENKGVAHARNAGVFAGSGVFVCCLDADDWIKPDFLEVCVSELEKDPTLGFTYTGLWYVKPNGEEGLSPWPEQFDYDKQLKGQNQLPTCNVSRRIIWERTGGQRQRYAPHGAGEEDAEFWLRACAYGWKAKKVTDAGLFVYSWMSGLVSGNKQHEMMNWRVWHPWVEDGQHPLASPAIPRHFSHPARQYDQPVISVIIPVGEKHKDEVCDALDSLEAQSFRRWEAIIVDDTGVVPDIDWQIKLNTVYPYIKITYPEHRGAGSARNAGAKIARAPLLLFLDADDYLHPDALDDMFAMWRIEGTIIYSDYIGKVVADKDSIYEAYGDRVLHYSDKYHEATIAYKSAEYDCNRAASQPRPEKNGYPYVWCLMTALVQKEWHDEIGGFDERMPSWEDWDYWVRMAKAGKCFTRIDKQLVAYRFYSGTRREDGLHDASNLIQYLIDKYKGVPIMPCNCRGKTNVVKSIGKAAVVAAANRQISSEAMNDSDMILCIYTSPNRGDHRVIGSTTRTDYGYRNGGAQFYVNKADISAAPHLFRPIVLDQPSPPETKVEATPPPVQIAPEVTPEVTLEVDNFAKQVAIEFAKEDDLQTIPGLSSIHVQMLNAAGVYTFADLAEFGVENITKLKGIGEKRGEMIIDFAAKKVAGEL